MIPKSDSNDGAAVVAGQFLEAIYEGDSNLVWALFSADAREFIVARGVRRGLTLELGRALLDGTADEFERAEFLGDLLAGLEKDLETVDLSLVSVSEDVEDLGPGKVRVRYFEAFTIELGPPLEALPVGLVELVLEAGCWRVERLIPRPG